MTTSLPWITAVRAAQRRGWLAAPENCEWCGKENRTTRALHAHHYLGYEPEHWLSVLFLCGSCHQYAHRRSNPPLLPTRHGRLLPWANTLPPEIVRCLRMTNGQSKSAGNDQKRGSKRPVDESRQRELDRIRDSVVKK